MFSFETLTGRNPELRMRYSSILDFGLKDIIFDSISNSLNGTGGGGADNSTVCDPTSYTFPNGTACGYTVTLPGYLWPVEDWLYIVGGTIGIYGSLWILVQYIRKRILRNTAGLLIAIIAILDIILALYYIWTAVVDDFLSIFDYDLYLDIIIDWTFITYCLLTVVLAFNTLYIVRFNGTSALLDKFKWLVIATCFILPIPFFFLPTAFFRDQPLFETTDTYCSTSYEPNCTLVNQYILMTSIIIFSIVCSLLSYGVVWWTFRNTRISSKTKRSGGSGEKGSGANTSVMSANSPLILVKRLAMVYSLTIIVLWLPFLIRYIIINITSNGSVYDGQFYYQFSFVTFLLWFRGFFTPLRGYMHAIAVFYVFRVVSHKRVHSSVSSSKRWWHWRPLKDITRESLKESFTWKNIQSFFLNCLMTVLLITPIEEGGDSTKKSSNNSPSPPGSQEDAAGERTVEGPEWIVSKEKEQWQSNAVSGMMVQSSFASPSSLSLGGFLDSNQEVILEVPQEEEEREEEDLNTAPTFEQDLEDPLDKLE